MQILNEIKRREEKNKMKIREVIGCWCRNLFSPDTRYDESDSKALELKELCWCDNGWLRVPITRDPILLVKRKKHVMLSLYLCLSSTSNYTPNKTCENISLFFFLWFIQKEWVLILKLQYFTGYITLTMYIYRSQCSTSWKPWTLKHS